jgi:hypothetical protein
MAAPNSNKGLAFNEDVSQWTQFYLENGSQLPSFVTADRGGSLESHQDIKMAELSHLQSELDKQSPGEEKESLTAPNSEEALKREGNESVQRQRQTFNKEIAERLLNSLSLTAGGARAKRSKKKTTPKRVPAKTKSKKKVAKKAKRKPPTRRILYPGYAPKRNRRYLNQKNLIF